MFQGLEKPLSDLPGRRLDIDLPVSDFPFCLHRGLCLCGGIPRSRRRGVRLTPWDQKQRDHSQDKTIPLSHDPISLLSSPMCTQSTARHHLPRRQSHRQGFLIFPAKRVDLEREILFSGTNRPGKGRQRREGIRQARCYDGFFHDSGSAHRVSRRRDRFGGLPLSNALTRKKARRQKTSRLRFRPMPSASCRASSELRQPRTCRNCRPMTGSSCLKS